MSDGAGAHPASGYEADVRTVERRAAVAMSFLGLTAVYELAAMLVVGWRNVEYARFVARAAASVPIGLGFELSDTLVELIGHVRTPLFVVTTTLVARWLYRVADVTRSIGEPVSWSPRSAVLGYLVPFVGYKGKRTSSTSCTRRSTRRSSPSLSRVRAKIPRSGTARWRSRCLRPRCGSRRRSRTPGSRS